MERTQLSIELTAPNGDAVVITGVDASKATDQFDGYVVRTGAIHQWDDSGRCRDNPQWNLDMGQPANQELWKILGRTENDIAKRLRDHAEYMAQRFPESGSTSKKSTP